MKLLSIKRAGICCLTHLEELTDIKGHSYCYLDCESCSDKDLCIELESLAKRWLNRDKVSTDKELFDYLEMRKDSRIKG